MTVHYLFRQLPSQLSVHIVHSASQALAGLVPYKVVKLADCTPGGDSQPAHGAKTENPPTPVKIHTVSPTPGLLASLVSKSEFYSEIAKAADNELDSHESDTCAPYLPSVSKKVDPLASLHISGDEDLQSQIRSLCEEFRDIFSKELPPTPAPIPPFHLMVDDSKWEHNRNRAPPQPKCTASNADIVRSDRSPRISRNYQEI
jgi:hypothetical protein